MSIVSMVQISFKFITLESEPGTDGTVRIHNKGVTIGRSVDRNVRYRLTSYELIVTRPSLKSRPETFKDINDIYTNKNYRTFVGQESIYQCDSLGRIFQLNLP